MFCSIKTKSNFVGGSNCFIYPWLLLGASSIFAGAPSIFAGTPTNSKERAKMSFTLSYKRQIVTRPYESLFNFFFVLFLLPPFRAVHGSAAFTVRGAFMLLLLSWLCCVVAASSFFFSFKVSYPSSSVIFVCLWLLLLVLLINCVFLGVHCVCLFLHWRFLCVFTVFFLVFSENEAYGLTIRIWFLKKKLWFLLVKSHTDCQSLWLVFF